MFPVGTNFSQIQLYFFKFEDHIKPYKSRSIKENEIVLKTVTSAIINKIMNGN